MTGHRKIRFFQAKVKTINDFPIPNVKTHKNHRVMSVDPVATGVRLRRPPHFTDFCETSAVILDVSKTLIKSGT